MGEQWVAAARLSEIGSGEMKEVEVRGTKVLLVRIGDDCHALGAHCTHYGAPLAKGALVGERIVCPWHHACFDARNGDLLDPPALDALPHFPLEVRGDEIFIMLPDAPSEHRLPPMGRREEADERLFVILGAGAAGYAAAQSLREEGFGGRIVMLTREERLPYDRPMLSKNYMAGGASAGGLPLRPDSFFEEHDIELWRGREVVRVEPAAKRITFAEGEPLSYDCLLIATGGIPRRLKLPNVELENIFVLRRFDQAERIVEAAEGATRAVVIGASFIAMEAAASLAKRGLAVTVVAPDEVPFGKTLGREIGTLFQTLHEQNGVQFRLGESVTGFAGEGRIEAVLLESGERLDADLVVVGIGVVPATDFLVGVEREADGGVTTDETLRAAEGLYVAGDIATLPDARTGAPTRVEHWRYALQQGRVAGRNMAGRRTVFDGVPFFWTAQFGLSLRYIGHTRGWDEIIVDGDVAEKKFLAFYVKEGRIAAVAGMKRDREMALLQEMMRLDRMPTVEQVRAGDIGSRLGSFRV